MVRVGGEGASARQRFVTKSMWLLGTCRNAIVVIATGALGFWFAAHHETPPFRLMGTLNPKFGLPLLLCYCDLQLTCVFLFTLSSAENIRSG